MRIKEITYQSRRDFKAIFKCSHCGYEEEEWGLKETISIGIGYDKELRVDTKIKTITYVDNKTHEETILDYITLQER